MQVQRSAFLQGMKPLLRTLVGRLSEKYGYASVLAADTRSKQYHVANTGVNAGEDELFTRRGFVLKVYDGRSYGEYSFTHIDEAAIPAIVKEVEGRLMPLAGKLPEGLSLSEYGRIADEPAILLKSSEYEVHPDEKGDEEILAANYDRTVRIPMWGEIRSLNLSNSVAIVLYEALRQNGFDRFTLTGKLRGVIK